MFFPTDDVGVPHRSIINDSCKVVKRRTADLRNDKIFDFARRKNDLTADEIVDPMRGQRIDSHPQSRLLIQG
jgi:hypothetical protein